MKKNDVNFNNYSRFLRQRNDYSIFGWCVYLDESKQVADRIECIEYILHPSFPNPIRRISDRLTCFSLQSEGWGTFLLNINIIYKDSSEKKTSYSLKLEEDDWPKPPILYDFSDSKMKAVYDVLIDKNYEWRKLSTIVRKTNLSESTVVKILNEFSQKDAVRKAYFLSIDKQEMWGATSVVGLLPKACYEI